MNSVLRFSFDSVLWSFFSVLRFSIYGRFYQKLEFWIRHLQIKTKQVVHQSYMIFTSAETLISPKLLVSSTIVPLSSSQSQFYLVYCVWKSWKKLLLLSKGDTKFLICEDLGQYFWVIILAFNHTKIHQSILSNKVWGNISWSPKKIRLDC